MPYVLLLALLVPLLLLLLLQYMRDMQLIEKMFNFKLCKLFAPETSHMLASALRKYFSFSYEILLFYSHSHLVMNSGFPICHKTYYYYLFQAKQIVMFLLF